MPVLAKTVDASVEIIPTFSGFGISALAPVLSKKTDKNKLATNLFIVSSIVIAGKKVDYIPLLFLEKLLQFNDFVPDGLRRHRSPAHTIL